MFACHSYIIMECIIIKWGHQKGICLCDFCLPHTSQPRPRLTSPHHSLPVLSIMPLFVLIEYLLAYLFLITDSHLSVLNTHTHTLSLSLSHTHTHTHTVKCIAPSPGCPWQSLFGPVSNFVSASHSVNGWVSLLVSQPVSQFVCQSVWCLPLGYPVDQSLNPSVSLSMISSVSQSGSSGQLKLLNS